MKTQRALLLVCFLVGCSGNYDASTPGETAAQLTTPRHTSTAVAAPAVATAKPAAPVTGATPKGSTPAMTFRVLESGGYGTAASAPPGSVTASSTAVATGAAALRTIWSQYIGEAQPPAVDFEHESVVILSLGQRSTGGYAIVPISVRFDGDTATVVARTQRPKSGAMTTMAFSAPFVAIAVPHQGVTRARWVDENGAEVPKPAAAAAAQ